MDSKHIYKALGVYLTNVRKNKKMTQKEMGESVNHNRYLWADLENGPQLLNLMMLKSLWISIR